MRFDKDKIKENASVYSKKTGNFLILSAKWISSVSNTTWNLACHYVDLKLKQGRLHGEYSKLGRQAYDQWKQNKDISLQKDLDELSRTDNEITQIQSTINELNTTLSELFSFKAEQAPVRQDKPSVKKTAVKKTQRTRKQVKKKPSAGKPANKDVQSTKEPAKEPVKKRTVRKRTGSSAKPATKTEAKKTATPKRRGRKPASTTEKTTGKTE